MNEKIDDKRLKEIMDSSSETAKEMRDDIQVLNKFLEEMTETSKYMNERIRTMSEFLIKKNIEIENAVEIGINNLIQDLTFRTQLAQAWKDTYAGVRDDIRKRWIEIILDALEI